MERGSFNYYAPCEAPHHQEGCECQRCTKKNCYGCKKANTDHFTPKCIAQVLGWSNNQLNQDANLQRLSLTCHRAKDRPTPLKRNQAVFQSKGGTIKFGQHV